MKDLDGLKLLLRTINGATFASLDALTEPRPGVLCETKAAKIILFRTKGGSGYENKVRRHLEEVGKDPSDFKVGPLPWGERVEDLPLIHHNGRYYLQCLFLAPGLTRYYLAVSGREVNPLSFGIKPSRPFNQGLPEDKQVFIFTYNIKNITRLALMGKELLDTSVIDRRQGKRAILKLRYD